MLHSAMMDIVCRDERQKTTRQDSNWSIHRCAHFFLRIRVFVLHGTILLKKSLARSQASIRVFILHGTILLKKSSSIPRCNSNTATVTQIALRTTDRLIIVIQTLICSATFQSPAAPVTNPEHRLRGFAPLSVFRGNSLPSPVGLHAVPVIDGSYGDRRRLRSPYRQACEGPSFMKSGILLIHYLFESY